MIAVRAAFLSAAALVLGAATADAQTTAPPASRPLPPGLQQAGGVMMMHPVDSAADAGESGGDAVPVTTSDRRPSSVHALSAADHDLYSKAFDAADRGDWIAARGLADQGHDAVARRLVFWRYLTDKNGGASFGEISGFLRDNPDWPLRQTLFSRAEHAMAPTMDASAVIAWFGGRPPNTGIGKVRLGEALIATGRSREGREMIRKAWIEDNFEPAEEMAIVKAHGDILTPDVDRERLDRLLWRGDVSAARREISRVGGDAQRLAEVRMALRSNPKAGERMVQGLPQSLRDDAGLIFDRARVMRRGGGAADVPDLLVRAPTREMAKIDPDHWWGEVNLAARQAIKDQSYRTAYRLVSDTGLSEGSDFAEAEFMAGWLALRFLHDPAAAVTHFRRLADGVSRPISRGRANYWIGRAEEAAGNLAAAAHAYRLAAKDPETFYGQLALAKLEPSPRLQLKNSPSDTACVRAAYEKDELTHAVQVLADLGSENLLRLFATHYVDIHPDAGYVGLLAGDLVRLGFRDVAVRVAKAASYNGIVLLPYLHPVIALPSYAGPGARPEDALVLGLIRQETEFNDDAVSRVGAVGIMQLMPATARQMAKLAGIAYAPASLKTDTRYNMQLGMTELSNDISDWGGSYILAAAAYNAGGSNVKRWIDTYGDPRSPTVDPIDWIEQIPFSETRNYVQRVIENTQVYRSRLAGRSEPLQILADLYRPNPPRMAPMKTVPPAIPAAPPAGVPPTGLPVPTARPDQARTDMPSAVQKAAPEETAALDSGAGIVPPQPNVRPANDAQPVPRGTRSMIVPVPRPTPDSIVTPKRRPIH